MQTQQTQFIGSRFSSTRYFTSANGDGSVPPGGLTIVALIAPEETSDEPSANEHIFGNIEADGSAGFVIERQPITTDTYTLVGRFGSGAEVDMLISMPASAVAGHPLIVHFTHDGEGGYASYLNGQLIDNASGAALVSSALPLTYGYSATSGAVAFSGFGIAVGMSFVALTPAQIYAQVALAMKTHNIAGADMTHLWSMQSAVRSTVTELEDYGTSDTPITLTLGADLAPTREIWDVQFCNPFADVGEIP